MTTLALGSFLQKGLRLEGHETDWVGGWGGGAGPTERTLVRFGGAGPESAQERWIEVLVELRSKCQRTAVIVLTGRSDMNEKVKCFNLGADDCLLKPFSFHELRARCKALLAAGRAVRGPGPAAWAD